MVKKEYVVYKREVDLSKEDPEVLKKYGLSRARYIYVGQCQKVRLKQRTNDFIYKIYTRTNKSKDQKDIRIYLDTAITYQNIVQFFIENKNMTKEQAVNYVFRNKENYIVIHNNLTKDESLELEKKEYHTLMVEKQFTNIKLLHNNDAQIIEDRDDKSIKLKVKNSRKEQQLQNPTISVTFNEDGTSILTINGTVIQTFNLNIIQVKNECDIIEQENEVLDNKKILPAIQSKSIS